MQAKQEKDGALSGRGYLYEGNSAVSANRKLSPWQRGSRHNNGLAGIGNQFYD